MLSSRISLLIGLALIAMALSAGCLLDDGGELDDST